MYKKKHCERKKVTILFILSGVFGRPGVDYPVLSGIPVTKFSCRDVQNSHNGYYADLDTNCQVNTKAAYFLHKSTKTVSNI